MSLTLEQAASLKKLVAAGKKGHDAVALVERAAFLGISYAEAMAALATYYTPSDGPGLERLEKYQNKKKARKLANARLTKGYERGASARLDRYLPLSDDQREVALVARTEDKLFEMQAGERAKVLHAAQNATGEPDDYSDGAAIVARIMEQGGPETRQPDAGGLRNDGCRLGYTRATQAIVGPSEVGKTLAMVAMAIDELRAGGSVLHLDTDDNGADSTFALYLSFGADPAVLSDPKRFRYSTVRTADGARRFVADAAEWKPSMAILDAVAPFLALFGYDPNSNSDYRAWHAEIPQRLSAAGASVWQIDHLNRADGDSARHAGGAGQKLAAISGVQYNVSVLEPFVPGQGGASVLKIAKDRPGGVRAASPAGKMPTAAVFRLDSRGGSSTWEFWRGRDGSDAADEQLEADVAFLLTLDPFPASRTKLQVTLKATQGQGWATDRARVALEAARQRRDSLTTFPTDTTTTKEQ